MRTLAIILLGFALCACRPAAPPPPLAQSVYVWQRQWTDDVTAGVAAAAGSIDAFAVLAAEVDVQDGRFVVMTPAVRWRALAAVELPVVTTIRVHVSLDALLGADAVEGTAEQIVALSQAVAARASEHGVQITELQLDYDCPTSELGRYARFLKHVRQSSPNVRISITALPTWLDAPSFVEVLAKVDEWVLQVHSFERPRNNSESLTVCRDDQVRRYITRAAEYGISFRVALPTYGYDLAFDADGAFVALAAEGGNRQWPESYSVRRVRSDPVAMARLVEEYTQARPASMLGIIWFRLPVATDEMNWSWDTLAQVMKGTAPAPVVTAELRYPEPGLAEVWVAAAEAGPATILLPDQFAGALAFDTFAGFSRTVASEGTIALEGELPADADEILVAWFRVQERLELPERALEVQWTQ